MDKNLALGAWEKDRVVIERSSRSGQGDFSDLSIIQQFPINIARAVYKFERLACSGAKRPAAFVLINDPLTYRNVQCGRAKDAVYCTGAKPLGGRIHFVPSSMIRCVYEEFEGSDESPILERLENIKMDFLPTLIYLPTHNGSVLEFFPHGTAEDKDRRTITIETGHEIQPEDIVSAINAVYDAELKTPDLSSVFPIWEEASKGRPIKKAEQGIQTFVRIGLATRFPWCRIAMEQPDKEGRTDLELMDESSAAAGAVTRHAILELKVLRSKGSTGNVYSTKEVSDHIHQGVEQAYAYGTRRNTKFCLLCCFDMRDEDTGDDDTFAHVIELAAKLAVGLHRWFLYRSSDHYRKACVSFELATPSFPAN